MRAVAVTELTLPVEAPPASRLAELAERAGLSLLEARRALRAVRHGRSSGKVGELLYALGDVERRALLASVAPVRRLELVAEEEGSELQSPP